jgi:hypothetical protein
MADLKFEHLVHFKIKADMSIDLESLPSRFILAGAQKLNAGLEN